mgnify:CR=1 FL=1
MRTRKEIETGGVEGGYNDPEQIPFLVLEVLLDIRDLLAGGGSVIIAKEHETHTEVSNERR